jgi:hypothetical protein
MVRSIEEAAMSFTVTDPALLSRLAAGDEVEFKDSTGRRLGIFIPDGLGKLPPGVKSPFSDEEMEWRRKEPKTGRPLAELMRDLE